MISPLGLCKFNQILHNVKKRDNTSKVPYSFNINYMFQVLGNDLDCKAINAIFNNNGWYFCSTCLNEINI